MVGGWKKLSSKIVHKNPWYSVTEDRVVRADGSRGKFYVFKKDPGVVIIPFDGKGVYLVNQYRYTFRKRIWEFPSGKSESQDYLKEAKKEFREETGFTAKNWKYLGEFACGPGHTGHMGKVFLAQDLTKGVHKREPAEIGMIVKRFTIREVARMIAKGKIFDSWAITAFYFFMQYLKKI
jgi:8-oxo-dGTP pyrophosphatase MutT (NUDIX family)